jgi:amino acid adenylation domain-containing protein
VGAHFLWFYWPRCRRWCGGTGDDDILIGTAIAARNQPQLEKLIGCFVNTLVIRGDLSGNPTFVELLGRVRQATLEAYDHQELPFEKVVEALNPQRTLAHTPLFQIMLVMQNAPKQVLVLPDLRLEELEFDCESAKFDLTLEVVEQDGLHCTIEYCTALFEKRSMQRLARHFKRLLEHVAKNPDGRISEVPIMDGTECDELIYRFNATESKYRRDVRLDRIFEERVEQTPNRIALIERNFQITYRNLNARANALAKLLVKEGLEQKRPVGIYMERSIDAVAALLAALKANAPYIPLDVANPRHRLDLMIRDSGIGAILTHRGLRGLLPDDIKVISIDEPISRDCSGVHFPADGTSEDLAYIIYTSGSTEVPKGVEGSHRAAVNRFEWMWRTYPFSTEDICCQKTALGFVDAVWEVFGPLLGGACSVIVPDECVYDLAQFVALLARHSVTRIVLVPSFLRMLLDAVPDLATTLPRLRLWSVSGEILSLDLARRFRAALPDATLLNIYGSSEVTADVTCYEVSRTEGLTSVPIGKPISNVQIYVLDDRKNLVPPLVAGEIHVRGECLARGYWKMPELTSQRFIENPYSPDRSRRIFATGDLGRILADGTIEYLGRLDTQIKLRGVRIEPSEIEVNLAAHPLVRNSVVVVHSDSSDTQRLIAYIERSEGAGSLAEGLRGFLRARLPKQMVPAAFIELDRMPLLPSGKIDRKALPSPSWSAPATSRTIVHGQTEVERGLSSIWMEVLELDDISIDDDFFDLGGHSLSGMRVLSRVRRDFHIDLPVRTLFHKPTIAALGLEVEQRKADQGSVRPRVGAPAALTSSPLLDILKAELSALPPDQADALLRSILAERNLEVERQEVTISFPSPLL